MPKMAVRRKVLLASMGFVALAGIYPASRPLCPDWNVTVIDTNDKPVPEMTVRRSCNDYSVNTHHEDDATTDERGRASFAAIPAHSAIFSRWIGNVTNVAQQGPHASFGQYSYV